LRGVSPKRKEDARLLAGAGRFVEDIERAGPARLGVVRSQHAHAQLKKIDLRNVRKRAGVLAAWSAADLADLARAIPAAWGGSHKGKPFAVPLLAAERARYVGEPIAVVVAEDAYALADALDAVEVEYPNCRPGWGRHLRALAQQLGLAVTGGSDCHGPDDAKRAPGACGVRWADLQLLRQRTPAR